MRCGGYREGGQRKKAGNNKKATRVAPRAQGGPE
jgi:hypothetical protein